MQSLLTNLNFAKNELETMNAVACFTTFNVKELEVIFDGLSFKIYEYPSMKMKFDEVLFKFHVVMVK